MIEEIKRLIASRDWRLRNLYSVKDKGGNIVRFVPNSAQDRILGDYHYRMDVLKARQLGVSTLTGILMLDMCLFASGVQCGIIDKALPDGKEKLAKIRWCWEMLDYAGDGSERDRAIALIGGMIKQRTGVMVRRGGLMVCAPEMDNVTMIRFANRSEIKVGTSMRGGTLNFLHVSELASVTVKSPLKAEEIKTGAINTVPKGGIIMKESTHEGGKSGTNWELTKTAMENVGRELDELDFKFYFFPWWGNKEYVSTAGRFVSREMAEYFEKVERENDVRLSDEQRSWYLGMQSLMGLKMQQEYPSSIDEALMARVEGSIYGEVLEKLRGAGRVGGDWEWSRGCQLYTSWDIGISDFCAVWLMNVTPYGVEVLDFHEAGNKDAAYFAGVVHGWRGEYGEVVSHFLPHDGPRRDFSPGNGSFLKHLERAGLRNFVIVPRIKAKWDGIGMVRTMLPQFRFSRRVTVGVDGRNSGFDSLCLYRKVGGDPLGDPLHDASSHAADAFRCFCEAVDRGFVDLHGGSGAYGGGRKPLRGGLAIM